MLPFPRRRACQEVRGQSCVTWTRTAQGWAWRVLGACAGQQAGERQRSGLKGGMRRAASPTLCGAAAPGAPECKDQQERDIDDPRQGCVHWTRSHVSWTGSATAVREDSTSTERRAANSVGLGGVPPRARRAQPEQHVCRGVNFNGQYDMHRRIAPRQPPHRTSGVRRFKSTHRQRVHR